MFRSLWPLAMLAAVLAASTALSTTLARAHEIVGNRFFPATLAIDDPGVNDELALPTVSIAKTGDVPTFKQLDVSGEFAKRITEDFGVSIAPTWSRLYAPGGPNLTGARGFQNLETTFKYRLFKSPEHEFVLSAGLEIEWGGSGAQSVGAERSLFTHPRSTSAKVSATCHQHELGAAFRDHRSVRYAIPGVSKTTSGTSTPTPARWPSTGSIHACSIGGPRSNTACPTSNQPWSTSVCPIL